MTEIDRIIESFSVTEMRDFVGIGGHVPRHLLPRVQLAMAAEMEQTVEERTVRLTFAELRSQAELERKRERSRQAAQRRRLSVA